MEIEESSGWDRSFLYTSSLMAEPLCQVFGLLRFRMVAPLDPTKFNHCTTKIREIATRVFIAAIALFSLVTIVVPVTFLALGVGSKIFRAIGLALQKNGYTHIRGIAPEKALGNGQAKIMTWNICGIAGGLHYNHGGVIDWRSRLDGIVAKIKKEDPDVLVLNEIYDAALGEALVEKLQSEYAHFFTHLGPNTMGSEGGIMVISKSALSRFSSTSFQNNDWTLNRTFATIDIKANPKDRVPCTRVIATHLIDGSKAKRMVQVAQMVDSIAKETLQLPTILAGDLNIERDTIEDEETLKPHFTHSYKDARPTRTGSLAKQWDIQSNELDEVIDYISLFKGAPATLTKVHLVEAFDDSYNTQTALSDHHGLAATVQI